MERRSTPRNEWRASRPGVADGIELRSVAASHLVGAVAHRKALGRHVASMRGAWRQVDVANAADIGLATLKRIEAGQAVNVTMYERLGAALGLPWGWWGIDTWFARDRSGQPGVGIEQAMAAVTSTGLADADTAGYVRELLELGLTADGQAVQRTHLELARKHLRTGRALARLEE